MKLQDISTEDLQSELERRGYFTYNMWQLDDVQMKIDEFNEANKTTIEFNDDEKMDILIDAFGNDATYAQIWESIEAEIEAKIEFNAHN